MLMYSGLSYYIHTNNLPSFVIYRLQYIYGNRLLLWLHYILTDIGSHHNIHVIIFCICLSYYIHTDTSQAVVIRPTTPLEKGEFSY